MSMPQLPEIVAGADLVETVTLIDRAGAAITTYTSGAQLALRVSLGAGMPALAMPASGVAWVDPQAGTVKITLAGSDTAGKGGDYHGYLAVTASGVRAEMVFLIKITAAPGAIATPTTYCSFDDCRAVLPWIDEVISTHPSYPTQMLAERHEARIQADRIIQRHYRRGSYERRQTSLDYLLDGGGGGPGWYRPYRSGGDDPTLQAWLDADRLVLTGATGASFKRWNAMYALAEVLDDLESGERGGYSYVEHAMRLRRRCDALISTLMIGIDTTDPADGVADIWIDFGIADTLKG